MFTMHRLFAAVSLGMVLVASAAHAAGELSPDISLILDGRFTSYNNGSDYELPGFMLSDEAGREEKGFRLGRNELTISAYIDEMFYGQMTSTLVDRNGNTEVELEEAYIESLNLDNDTAIRAGRFFSDIGYLNSQHQHNWDFADAPLVYRGLFGDQLRDDGIQLKWIVPTNISLKLGAEMTSGAHYPAGGAANGGKGAYALYAKLGDDLGANYSWQIGLSYWQAKIEGRTTLGHAHAGVPVAIPTFSGDSNVRGIDVLWKWTPDGNASERVIKFQAEYFIRDENGTVTMDDGVVSPESSRYDGRQAGWYAQAVYRFLPSWRIGLRYDQLGSDNTVPNVIVLTGSGLDDEGQHPRRKTLMFDYSYSKYSLLRLQYARDESYPHNDNIMMLQYVMSLGTHGAHQF